MDILKKIFPTAFKAKDVNPFIVALIFYTVIGVVAGITLGLLARIPFLGIAFSLTGSAVGLYCTLGIVLSILNFVKVIKED